MKFLSVNIYNKFSGKFQFIIKKNNGHNYLIYYLRVCDTLP